MINGASLNMINSSIHECEVTDREVKLVFLLQARPNVRLGLTNKSSEVCSIFAMTAKKEELKGKKRD